MSQFFLSFLATSLFMTIIIAAVLIIRALLPNVFSPKIRYVVWIIILLGLIIPVRPFLGDGLVDFQLPFAVSTEGQTVPILSGTGSTGNSGITGSAAAGQNLPVQEPLVAAISDGGIGMVSSLRALSVIEMFAIAWMVVALAVLAYHVWKHARFLGLVRRWGSPVDDKEALTILQGVLTEKGIAAKKIALKRCEFVSTSMIVGFFRPMILLPDNNFDADELEMIFHHELIHWRRGDLFVKLLSVIALSLNWFNPAVYIMNSVMQADCEASCDQLVIASVGNENKHFYAETIMEMIGYRSANVTALSTCFYGSRRGIKTRMEAIISTADNSKKVAIVTLATSLSTLVLVMGLVVFAGSVFIFSEQGQSDLERMTDVAAVDDGYDNDVYADVDDLNFDSPAFSFEQIEEDDKINVVFQLEDGTTARAFVNELGTISVLCDDGTISWATPRYPPGGTNISSEEAVEIAREDLTNRNVTAALGGLDYGWGEGIDISWEFEEVWVWVLLFYVQDESELRFRYLICTQTGDIVDYTQESPPFDIG